MSKIINGVASEYDWPVDIPQQSQILTGFQDPIIKQLKKEKDALYNALIITRTKYNNDKSRYRRKAKKYRYIIKELQKFIDKALEVYDNVDVQTLMLVKDELNDLINKTKNSDVKNDRYN